MTDDDLPPSLMQMYINSTDTLRVQQVDQTMKTYPGWNDQPPLFKISKPSRNRFRGANADKEGNEQEDPLLLKGMIRKGIPPPLRCAVWMSNVIQSCHQHQPLSYAHEYRTLSKVRVLDAGYDTLWQNNVIQRDDVRPIVFGNTNIQSHHKDDPGVNSLWRVLFALHSVLGVVEYAPLVPTIAALLLTHMSESYVFCSVREMSHNTSWYWACSKSEHVAQQKAFLDILSKLHPSTAKSLQSNGFTNQYCEAIFSDFFQSILSEKDQLRVFDVYTLEGSKVLFRVGITLLVLFHKESKTLPDGYNWWKSLQKYCQTKVSIDYVLKKAYGFHGKGVRKRYRFPGRNIIQRIVQLEEEQYLKNHNNAEMEGQSTPVQPLGLVLPRESSDSIMPLLSRSTKVRSKLAEWLPLALRFTKLDLIYTTNHHGRTIDNFYRHVSKAKHTVLLLEPLNTSNLIVGCYASQTWHFSTRVYGDGNCFLFRISLSDDEGEDDNSICWKWQYPKSNQLELGYEAGDTLPSSTGSSVNTTAILEQFQVGTKDYISMGGNSKGDAGLRLNEDLTRAESSKAAGFDNLPLASDEIFEVGVVEVYQMVRQMDGVPIH